MTLSIRLIGALGATTAAVALFAGPAAAKITRESVAGIEIGTSEDAVREELGPPASSRELGQGVVMLDYPRRKLDVLVSEDQVIRIRTTSRSQATSSGVGPGVSESTMRRKLRGEKCSTARATRVCWIRNKRTVTAFNCRRGRVVMAEIARLPG